MSFNISNVEFNIIVAFDKDKGIGKNNKLPWDVPDDLKYFRNITTKTKDPSKKNAIIMGRKTWESLQCKPLPDRENIVISRGNMAFPRNVLKADSIEGGIWFASMLKSSVEKIFIIGGASIYKYVINMHGCKKIYATEILSSFDCDTFFPEFLHKFEFKSCMHTRINNNKPYFFSLYKRI